MKTTVLPVSAPSWLVLDAEGQSLGRVASKAAHVLRGKHKPGFSGHQLCGDHVIILNIEKLAITPAKARRKTYVDHTGYQGSLSRTSLGKMMERKPLEVMQKAVKGMLPGNRLRPQMLKRLHLFAGSEHTYAAQKPQAIPVTI